MKQSLDQQNTIFSQAVAFINQTQKPVFLTGKAGTGKTTFLKYIQEHSYKKMAITAPTGVAAMNAGGTTLHALFWLPFGVFIEDYSLSWDDNEQFVYNRNRLFSTIKLTKARRSLLQELELLVIDEVSMVRADTLDAIDVILKSVRGDLRPFGGVQVLFVGDLYQLPPVVRDHEWQVLKTHYNSVFFFDAKVFKQDPPVLIELEKIYRQQDNVFVNLLNKIRENQTTQEDLVALNTYYRSDFQPDQGEKYVTLTSHNRLAEDINEAKLAGLTTPLHRLNAVIRDEFQRSMFPVEEVLNIRVGAQVMFTKNDTGEDRRYFNGKIGEVKEIDSSGDEITVSFQGEEEDVCVKRETWENIRYVYDQTADKINEQILGTFAQFPLRLAWAITIHKSQGLTFDKAIVDAGTSFAAGQVYVALSRMRSLDGLVLRSKISSHAIRTDDRVMSFMQGAKKSKTDLQEVLRAEQRRYLGHILLRTFRWNNLSEGIQSLIDSQAKVSREIKETRLAFLVTLQQTVNGQQDVANKFVTQLQRYLAVPAEVDYSLICERSEKAADWFLPQFLTGCMEPLQIHIQEWKVRKRAKKYITQLEALWLDFTRKEEQLKHSKIIAEALSSRGQRAMEDVLPQTDTSAVPERKSVASLESDTKRISLDMFMDGMEIDEIAKSRDMVAGTIYGHLIHFIGQEIEANDLIDLTLLERIVAQIKAHPNASATEIKTQLGSEVDYPQIRIAQRHLEVSQAE